MTESSDAASSKAPWWKSACIYQIYPASFRSAKGGAFGDLAGIIEKLPYLQSLGVDALWISPFFASPQVDYGYDISDYTIPDPRYGKLEEVDELIKKCHDHGMKIIFDLVINHTSDQHKWFKESRSSKDNPFRNYYHWHPGRVNDKGERIPPTNWRGAFGSSVWEWDEHTQEYYLHMFCKEQPDLCWENDEVRKVLYEEVVNYWFKRGIDGYRVDTSALYSKHDFVDVKVVDPHNYDQPSPEKMEFGPRLDEFLQEMYRETFEQYGGFTLAEMGGKESGLEIMLRFVARKQKKYAAAIRFDLVYLDHGTDYYLYHRKCPLPEFKKVMAGEQELANPKHDAWLVNYLENHDQARSVTRYTDDSPEYRKQGAKMLAILLTTISGTLLMYEGEEIGMINAPKEWGIEKYPDPMTTMFWSQIQHDIKHGKQGHTMEGALAGVQKLARDHARTPMQWSAEKNGGFSTADETWMAVMDSYKEINVEEQEQDPSSVLNFWRKMLKLRQADKDRFVFANFELLDESNENTFSYVKHAQNGKDKLFVILNWTGAEQTFALPDAARSNSKMLASSYDDDINAEGTLRPWEGRAYSYSS